jgi:hypothetical protein
VTKPIRVTVRGIPGAMVGHTLDLDVGEPEAEMRPGRSRCRHPHPWEGDELTQECRDFISQAARAAVERDGHYRFITWPDGEVTSFIKQARESSEPPSAGHGEQHE